MLDGEVRVGEVLVGIIMFRGREGHVAVLVDPSEQPGRFGDASYPRTDYGHLWLRETEGYWVISGKVSAQIARGWDEVHQILEHVGRWILRRDETAATHLEIVETRLCLVASGEEGFSTYVPPPVEGGQRG